MLTLRKRTTGGRVADRGSSPQCLPLVLTRCGLSPVTSHSLPLLFELASLPLLRSSPLVVNPVTSLSSITAGYTRKKRQITELLSPRKCTATTVQSTGSSTNSSSTSQCPSPSDSSCFSTFDNATPRLDVLLRPSLVLPPLFRLAFSLLLCALCFSLE